MDSDAIVEEVDNMEVDAMDIDNMEAPIVAAPTKEPWRLVAAYQLAPNEDASTAAESIENLVAWKTIVVVTPDLIRDTLSFVYTHDAFSSDIVVGHLRGVYSTGVYYVHLKIYLPDGHISIRPHETENADIEFGIPCNPRSMRLPHGISVALLPPNANPQLYAHHPLAPYYVSHGLFFRELARKFGVAATDKRFRTEDAPRTVHRGVNAPWPARPPSDFDPFVQDKTKDAPTANASSNTDTTNGFFDVSWEPKKSIASAAPAPDAVEIYADLIGDDKVMKYCIQCGTKPADSISGACGCYAMCTPCQLNYDASEFACVCPACGKDRSYFGQEELKRKEHEEVERQKRLSEMYKELAIQPRSALYLQCINNCMLCDVGDAVVTAEPCQCCTMCEKCYRGTYKKTQYESVCLQCGMEGVKHDVNYH